MKRVAVLGIVGVLSGCAPLLDQDFWDQATSFADDNYTALGLEQLASGDYASAEKYFDEAIRKDPRDGHAILWRSVLYQNTNRSDRAEEGYKTLIAMNPAGTVLMTSPSGTQPRPLRDAAEFNLRRLARGLPGSLSISDSVSPNNLGFASAMSNPMNEGEKDFEKPHNTDMNPSPVSGNSLSVSNIPAGAALSAADQATAKRFSILRDLQKKGLITPEEYSVRRTANLGALLPMSQPAPGAFLDTPPPDGADIEQRLNQINRSLQIGAITVQEHSNERTAILDALLPAQPAQKANPAPAPQGLMDAARKIARLEDLSDMKLITPDEFKRERDAIEASIVEPAKAAVISGSGATDKPTRKVASGVSRPVILNGGEAPATGNGAATTSAPSTSAMALSAGNSMVHLASYRNPAQAERGWQILEKRYPDLASQGHEVDRVTIPGKGVYYRLFAKGMDNNSAVTLCRTLKQKGQYCDVK